MSSFEEELKNKPWAEDEPDDDYPGEDPGDFEDEPEQEEVPKKKLKKRPLKKPAILKTKKDSTVTWTDSCAVFRPRKPLWMA